MVRGAVAVRGGTGSGAVMAVCRECGVDRIPDFVDRDVCRRCRPVVAPVMVEAQRRRAVRWVRHLEVARLSRERARARAAEWSW